MVNRSYWIQRTKRHLLLGAIAVVIASLAYWASPPPLVRHRLSMGTAYAALVFLVAALWLGPWNILRKKPNPVSSDLRRDIGIWAGVLALAHTGIGLTVHLPGRMWMYFFRSLHPLAVQNTKFGFANYVGLLAALLFLVLLAISNDLSLRRLGTRRWKSVQRWTYLAFALTLAHAVAYQLVEKRHLPWVLFFAVLSLTAIAIQVAGYRRLSVRKLKSQEPHVANARTD
jgi:methionine sulfoxide reductase heme-binding subunit